MENEPKLLDIDKKTLKHVKILHRETPGKAARNAILPSRCNNGRRDGGRGGMERETRVQCRRPRRPGPRPSVSQMAAERMEITGDGGHP